MTAGLVLLLFVAGDSAPPRPPKEHWTAPRLGDRPIEVAVQPPSVFGPKSSLKLGAVGALGGAGGGIGGGEGAAASTGLCAHFGVTTTTGTGVVDEGHDDGGRVSGVLAVPAPVPAPMPVLLADGAGLGAADVRPWLAALDGRPLAERGLPREADCDRLTIKLIMLSVSSACGAGLMAVKGEAERLLLTNRAVSAREVDEPAAAVPLRPWPEAALSACASAPPLERPSNGDLHVVKEMRRERLVNDSFTFLPANVDGTSFPLPSGLAFFGVGTTNLLSAVLASRFRPFPTRGVRAFAVSGVSAAQESPSISSISGRARSSWSDGEIP